MMLTTYSLTLIVNSKLFLKTKKQVFFNDIDDLKELLEDKIS